MLHAKSPHSVAGLISPGPIPNFCSVIIIIAYRCFINSHHAGALTDRRLVVGITKFDLNYSRKRGRKPSEKEVQKSVMRSIKEATSVDISEECIIPLCSEWALSSSKLAGALISDPIDEREVRLQDALTDLKEYPHMDSLRRGQGENLTENPGKVVEYLEKASGIYALKERYII